MVDLRSEAARAAAHRVAGAVAAELVRRDPAGTTVLDLARLVDTGEFDPSLPADLLVPPGAVWEEHIGPFLDAEAVRRLLSKRDGSPITKQAVAKRRDLLALRTGSRRVVYPRFQFRGGGVLPGLDRVLAVVPDTVASRWTLASWLMTPQHEFGGDRPADLLAEGVVEPVVTLASEWAGALAS